MIKESLRPCFLHSPEWTAIDKKCNKYFMNLRKGTIERITEDLHDGLYIVDRDRIITY